MRALMADLRSAERKRVLMRATVLCARGSIQVRIKNISSLGALLNCSGGLPLGEDVLFRRGGIFVAAKIIRAHKAEAALKFYTPLLNSDMQTLFHPVIFEGDSHA
jgi:hypothetical protein